MYRLITEYFLGLQKEGNKLKFVPCVPKEWESFKVRYRYMNTVYNIVVTQNSGGDEMIVTVDGVEQQDKRVTLMDDGVEHLVNVMV